MKITLATLPNATAQEVFNQVADHLLTQMKVSKVETKKDIFDCQYRGEDNTSCAAGCLISDKEYGKHFENKSWANLARRGLVPNAHTVLIGELQNVHDENDPEMWKISLMDIARVYKLQPSFKMLEKV
jgi:hypothetical protein